MVRYFETELKDLNTKILHMGALTERMIQQSIKCLVERNLEYIGEVFKLEEQVNDLQIQIDETAISLIAVRQPVADDLRFLFVASKISADLERIADQTINICQNAQIYLQFPQLKPLIDIPRMAQISQKMILDCLNAYVEKNASLARDILKRDDEVDNLKDQIFRELLTYMMSEPSTIQRALPLILISRNLERIGDHATNIAEDIIYLVEGREVRHHYEEKMRRK